MLKKTFVALLLLAFAAGAFHTAYAVQSYLNSFVSTYQNAASTQLNSCLLCHPSGGYSLNPYASAYRDAGHNYKTIEPLDSDGDGYTNIAEINAGTLPGNSASRPSAPDTAPPTVTAFTIPSTAATLTVSITSLTATDNTGVTGYLVNESSAKPSASAAGWSASAQTSYTFSSAGTKTLYAWAKDAAGNVSASRSAAVTVTSPPVTNGAAILTAPKYGQYYSDPESWLNAGYRVNIWSDNVAINAQAVDASGKKIAGPFSYKITSTGQYGVLDLIDAQNLAYQKTLSLPLGENYAYTVTVNGRTAGGNIYSMSAKCDSCHRAPEGHIANRSTWGNCNGCHNLADVTHKHVYKFGATFQCYTCHTQDGSKTDVHSKLPNSSGYTGFTCTECHGDLSMTQDNTFKTASMAGLPRCADCHDPRHGEPAAGKSFADSVGHGGLLCISCHNSPHRIQNAMNFGNGGENNCSACHPNETHGGPNCGQCHGSSQDPHLVPSVKSPPTHEIPDEEEHDAD